MLYKKLNSLGLDGKDRDLGYRLKMNLDNNLKKENSQEPKLEVAVI